MSGLARLHRKAVEDGALSARVKVLMAANAISINGCEGCFTIFIVRSAIRKTPGTSVQSSRLSATSAASFWALVPSVGKESSWTLCKWQHLCLTA